MHHDEIAAIFKHSAEKNGRWITQHVINGTAYGGKFGYLDDPRFSDFLQIGKPYGDILELGCFEGGHTVRLAKLRNVHRVVAVDGRDYLVEKTRAAVQAHELAGVEVQQCDVNDVSALQSLGTFDQIHCAGLLYHLKEPWKLLSALRPMAPRLFISTNCADKPLGTENGYRGWSYREQGYEDPLSGLQPTSFWPILGDLITMLADSGWDVETLRYYPKYKANVHDRVWPLANVQCVAAA